MWENKRQKLIPFCLDIFGPKQVNFIYLFFFEVGTRFGEKGVGKMWEELNPQALKLSRAYVQERCHLNLKILIKYEYSN